MHPKFYLGVGAVTLACLSLTAAPAVPELNPEKDLPRFPAVEPKDALKTLRVKKGFHAELVASEPLVTDPITCAFDEDGRCFVVQMTDYSERRNESLGKIRLLTDTDGDGKFDAGTDYVTGLPWPTGVFPWDGGIFVISTPDLYYCKDTNGDGIADIRKIVYTGFGNTKDRLNVQGLANGFNWGLDNRIYALSAPNGGILTNLAVPTEKPLDLNSRNFSINPRTMVMRPENGGGQYGMNFDSKGHLFTCSNSEHLMMFLYEYRYATRNPYYNMPRALSTIAVDGGAAEVYRISPEEPWRVIRTKWRVSGVTPGMIEGGGRSAGYFTGATGVTLYRGNAFPADFLDNAFTGDAGGNLVHRKKLYPNDVALKGVRPDDEKDFEFFASNDTWFRPVHFQNAPDGCLYVMDMYRETIEHPWSLPEPLKSHLDLNSGNDRGRIYRIVPDGFKQPALPRLGKASIKELVATLESSNGWHRETASRLLYQRQDKAAVGPLGKLAEKSPSAYGRMHALYALDGLSALKESHILRALRDSDPLVREHAVKLSEHVLKNGVPSRELWMALDRISADVSTNVIYQLAFTLGEIEHPERSAALAACVRADLSSHLMQAAVLSSLKNGASDVFNLLAADEKFIAQTEGQGFLSQLAGVIGAKNNSNEVRQVISFVAAHQKPADIIPIVRALAEGLQRANTTLDRADTAGSLKAVYQNALATVGNRALPAATRLPAIQLLSATSFEKSGAKLLALLNAEENADIQLAALHTLGQFSDGRMAKELLARWAALSPRLRDEALALLIAKPDRANALLDAVEKGQVRSGDINSNQAKFLRTHRNKGIAARAEKVFAATVTGKRQDVYEAYKAALNLPGKAEAGHAIYTARCISCHRLAGEGFQLGPDFVTVKNMGKEKLLLNILDPNREVAAQYQAHEIETKDDETYLGMVMSETPTSLTLRQAYGKEDVIARNKIKKNTAQNQSLMPEGLEADLKPQDLADLMEYIITAK